MSVLTDVYQTGSHPGDQRVQIESVVISSL